MDALRKFIVAMCGLVLSITTSVLVMIHGWGVTPKSWVWILVISFFGHTLAYIFVELAKSDK